LIAVLCDELKDYFSLSLVMKIKSKLKLQKIDTTTENTVPPGGMKSESL
jgi:hypothetical protein